ncbi:MAG: hypothetical protein Kow00107_05930 [Planctomycetota bacterium]
MIDDNSGFGKEDFRWFLPSEDFRKAADGNPVREGVPLNSGIAFAI